MVTRLAAGSRCVAALFALLFPAAACFAQDYTHRGFVETRFTFYPQAAANDRAKTIGDALIRYEGMYRRTKSLQFAGAFDLRTDTHHQVDRELNLSWADRGVRRPLATVRRLSALYYKGGLTVEAGKQFVRWGKTDILTPTDRFAPRDYLTVVDNDFLPITAARASFEKGANTIEAVWSPRVTTSRIPLLNQRWVVLPASVPPGLTIRDIPDFPSGSQAGVRWKYTGMAEFALSFYEGFHHLPSFEQYPFVSPEPVFYLSRFYPDLRMAGLEVAIPLRWLTVKGETGYFASNDPRADDYALYVIQLERQSGEWFFVGGYAGEILSNRGTQLADFSPDRGLTKTLLGRAGYTIDVNRSIAMEAAVRQNGDGLWVKFEYSQGYGQHWRVTANVTALAGRMQDFLGQYERNSHAMLILRYSF
jgi:hypothetical protein